MSLDRFKKGDKVKVMNQTLSHKPIVEGIATCIKLVSLAPFLGLERWLVQFPDGDKVVRDIAIENKVTEK